MTTHRMLQLKPNLTRASRRFSWLIAVFLIPLTACAATKSSSKPELSRDVRTAISVLPESEAFTKWLLQTGAQPPEFNEFKSIPGLINPLIPLDNPDSDPITSIGEWLEQRSAIKDTLQRWQLGLMPPTPDTVTVERLESVMEWNAISRRYRLHFGADSTHMASLRIELFIPDGDGPFPVFMTQSNHRSWARIALQRGYIGVVYAAADIEDDAAEFSSAYPRFDWSLLAKRAWAASRVVDFLETFDMADTSRIAIGGHSRNGKQSLIAAAFDDRIDAVISSSAGAGGIMPWRISSEYEYAESIERMTRVFPTWFSPWLRFFAGREDRLPYDMQHQLALIAPRPCLVSTAINDGVEQTWAIEQSMDAARPAWALYDAADNLQVQWRSGGHETHPEIIQRYFDWLDGAFDGDPTFATDDFIHPNDWTEWNETTAVTLDLPETYSPDLFTLNNGEDVDHKDTWLSKRWQIQQNIRTVLGKHPPAAAGDKIDYGLDPKHIRFLLERQNAGSDVDRVEVVFGDYISGDLYVSSSASTTGQTLPGILFLHAANRPKGYVAGYRNGEHFYRRLAKAGYAVFCFDMIGYGRRIDEDAEFYTRFPAWSLLGKMVWDARSAFDRMTEMPQIDPDQIFIMGYGLGAWVALHTAALEHRHAGTAVLSPPGPLDVPDVHAGHDYLDLFARQRLLQPQLALLAESEQPMPYDLPHLLAASAPKPLLLIQPRLNWRVDHHLQMEAFKQAKKVYGLYHQKGNIDLQQPNLSAALDPAMQGQVIIWLNSQLDVESEE